MKKQLFFAAFLWVAAALTAQEVRVFPHVAGYVQSAAFSPDGRRIASGSTDKTVKIWDGEKLSGGGRERTLTGHSDWVYSVGFSPDCRRVVSASAFTVVFSAQLSPVLKTMSGMGPRFIKPLLYRRGKGADVFKRASG